MCSTSLGFGNASGRVGVDAIIVDAQRRQARHQINKVEPTVLEAPVDMLGCDIVAAAAHPRFDPLDMQRWTGKTDVPNENLNTLRCRLCE